MIRIIDSFLICIIVFRISIFVFNSHSNLPSCFLLIGGIDTVVGILIAPFCPAYIFVGGLKIVELIFKFEESLCLTYICSFKDHSKGWQNVQCEQVNMFVFKKCIYSS